MISKFFQVLRKALTLIAVAIAVLVPGSDEASAAQTVVSGEFVGAIPDSDPKDPPGGTADELVAVAVYDPSPTGARPIRIYICDSEAIDPDGDAEWFTGIIQGDAFNLSSVGGDASVQGQLTETAVTGTATLADGRVLDFRAVRAREGAGLFEFFFLTNGSYSGISASGTQYKGTVIQETITGGIVTRLIQGRTKTLKGQTSPPFVIRTRFNPPGAVPSTVIILPDATDVAGRSTQIKRDVPTTNFYDWDID